MDLIVQETTLLPQVTEAFSAFLSPFIPADIPVTLRGGKMGYVLEISGEELPLPAKLSEIQAWCLKYANTPKLTYAGYRLDQIQRYLLTPTGEGITLTEKETALLALFFQHIGEVFSKKDLLTTVWGWAEDAQTHTIESHIYALRQKCPFLPITASPEGYQLPPT